MYIGSQARLSSKHKNDLVMIFVNWKEMDPDPDPTPVPTPFFSDFKEAKKFIIS